MGPVWPGTGPASLASEGTTGSTWDPSLRCLRLAFGPVGPPPPSPGRASGPSPGARQPACSPVGLAFWALLRGSWASVVCPLRCFLSFLCGYPLLSSLSHKAPILGIPGGKTSPEGSSPGGILSRRHLPGRPDSWRCWAGLSSEVIDLLWVTQQKGLVKSVNHPTWSVWG